MNKLHLDGLKVESFVTTAGAAADRGTVMGHARTQTCNAGCPLSYGGTCVITCAAGCDTR